MTTLAWDYADGEDIPAHRHSWHQLVYATTGVMTVTTPAGSWVVPPHRGVWVPGGTEHSIQISGAVSMRTIYLWKGVRRLPKTCHVLSVSPLLRELIAHAVSLDILDRRVDAQRRLMDVILDQLAALPVAAMNIPQPKDARALKLATHLQANPGERRPLGALGRVVGASPRTLERLFKADTGMSLGRWRQQLRLAHSLRLLAVGQPVTSVALDVGYDSPSAFVSSFHKTFGTTPGRYFRSSPRRSEVDAALRGGKRP